MKFRYIVIDWEWGNGPFGTDSLDQALNYSRVDEYTVVDVVTGKFLGELRELEEAPAIEDDAEEDELEDDTPPDDEED